MPSKKSELEKREILRMSNEESNKITKECLQTALIYLMNEKPFDKITITELVARSGVSRSAFYRNYSSKDDIIEEICDDILAVISKAIHDIQNKDDVYQLFYQIFEEIKENEQKMMLFLKADYPDKYLMNHALSLERVLPSQSIEAHYNLIAIQSALVTMLVNWLQDGMKEDTEFMARFCADFVNKNASSK